jgi:hypothetical protein
MVVAEAAVARIADFIVDKKARWGWARGVGRLRCD